MTLPFEIYQGNKDDLPTTYHEGYFYFAIDTGEIFVDMGGTRVQSNAESATKLKKKMADGTIKTIEISDIYTKTEVDNQAKKSAAVSYTLTIGTSDWSGSGPYTYTYTNTDLTCGLTGDVPPIVTPNDGTNIIEYSKIDKALATAGKGIVFTATAKPTVDLNLVVIDQAQK